MENTVIKREDLQARKAELTKIVNAYEQRFDLAKGNLNAVRGALSEVELFISKLDSLENLQKQEPFEPEPSEEKK